MKSFFRRWLLNRTNSEQREPNICAVFTVSGNSTDYLTNGTLVAIASFRLTNPGIPVYVLYSSLSRPQRHLFADCILIKTSFRGFRRSAASIVGRPDLDLSTYLRFNLAIPELRMFDHAIYLDSDLVVLDYILDYIQDDYILLCRPMYSYPLASQFASGTKLLSGESLSVNLPAVNAGVIFVNLRRWRELDFLSLVNTAIKKYGHDEYIFNDQSLLNLVGYSNGFFRYLPPYLNFMIWPDVLEAQITYQLVSNKHGYLAPLTSTGHARVVHWTGPLKPWHSAFKDLPEAERVRLFEPVYKQFISALDLSPK